MALKFAGLPDNRTLTDYGHMNEQSKSLLKKFSKFETLLKSSVNVFIHWSNFTQNFESLRAIIFTQGFHAGSIPARGPIIALFATVPDWVF